MVDLDGPGERLVNANFAEYMTAQMNDGEQVGARMSAYSRYDDFKPSNDLVASWSFDDLVLKTHVFNKTTGRPETSSIRISTRTKDERGRGIVEISSQLPFDDHARFIQALVESLNRPGVISQAPVCSE